MIRDFLIPAIAAVYLGAMAVSPAGAAPPWWQGAPEDVPAAAAQTGKPVILYFHSPTAGECIRMEEETWSPMNPVWADLQYLWLRLEPKKDAEFFKYWKINQVPQVVVLDSQMKDQLRLRGFRTLDQIKESLSRISRDVPSLFTTVNGGQLPAESPILDLALLERDPFKGHLYLENFDKYRLIGSISNPPFAPVIQAASRIHTSGGTDGTPALIVDSGTEGRALIQIDISRTFSEIEQVLGRIRVTANLKAVTAIGKMPLEVMALNVLPLEASGDESQEQMYFASLSNTDRNRWVERELISSPVNFRMTKAFVLLGVQVPRKSFVIDDLTVDLIPYDDFIPYVEATAEVRMIADLSGEEESGTSSDFFGRLSDKARVESPEVVANQSPDLPSRQRKDLSNAQVQEVAEYAANLNKEQRAEYIKTLKLSRNDMLRVTLRARRLEKQMESAGR